MKDDMDKRLMPRFLQDTWDTLQEHGVSFPLSVFSQVFMFLMACHRAASVSQPGALVIVGPPGAGKSYLLAWAARLARVTVIRFSLADCESSGAGDPAGKLQQAALQAEEIEQSGAQTLVVIEDFELGMACPQRGEGSSTNRPQIQGVLQELLDGTHSVGGRVLAPKRFAFTSNDLTAVRASMVRESRTIVIECNPDRQEKARIARSMLAGVLPKHVLRRTSKSLSRLTIAEIAAVRAEIRQHVERMITFDLTWSDNASWLGSKRTASLTDALSARLVGRRDVRKAVSRVRQRAKARGTYL